MADSEKNEAADTSDTQNAVFPSAHVVEKPAGLLGTTRLWWLALACLLLAVGLVIGSMPALGTKIKISFPQGHGLQAEDAIRYRGIDVGVVESVHLTPELDSVDVHVNLLPTAKQLAVQGSRFWIVRPQLSITGVSGLETAVGHKYIEVIPGEANATAVSDFTGLAQPPADTATENGIEILLQADARHSVTRGSAIHFRGVDIGKILSVGLSQDARHVEIRGKIDESYRSLVTTESKFWATGGVDFDFSLRDGLKLETESLDTLARGGVSMLVVGSGKPAGPGHVFPLAAAVNEDWIARSNNFRSTSARMRGCVNLNAQWKEKLLFRNWKKSQTFSGISITDDNGKSSVLVPADIVALREVAEENSLTVSFLDADGVDTPVDVATITIDGPVASLPGHANTQTHFKLDEISTASQPAAALVVRRARDGQVHLHLPITKSDIAVSTSAGASFWRLNNFSGDRAVWHGCPVLLASDSSLIGMLLVDDKGPRVHLLNPSAATDPQPSTENN